MYALEIKPEADKIFRKLAKKDPLALQAIHKKIVEIRNNPHHEYKHLRAPLQDYTSAHLQTHFVLIFKIDHARKEIAIYYYGHHDDVYEWKEK